MRAIQKGAFGGWDEIVLPMMAADTPMPGLLAAAFRASGLTLVGVKRFSGPKCLAR